MQRVILQLENEDCFSFEALKERLANRGKAQKITKVNYFNEYAQQLITNTFAANKAGTAMAYQVAAKRMMGFANNPKLKFTDIDYTFLEAFTTFVDEIKNSIPSILNTAGSVVFSSADSIRKGDLYMMGLKPGRMG